MLINRKYILAYFLILSSIFIGNLNAACPQLETTPGVYSANPIWTHCDNNPPLTPYTLSINPNIATGAYTIDYGDGQVFGGANINPGTPLTHVYPAGVDSYTITLITAGCVLTGIVYKETPTYAKIGIPGGQGLTICSPDQMQFVNETNQTAGVPVSTTTTFNWDFGDGTTATYDYTNAGQTITHTYGPNTPCQLNVTLRAQDRCDQGIPSLNLFGPIRVWRTDDANLIATPSLLCLPNTVVTYSNTTILNCQPGNNSPRRTYWNFGNYWGLGHDSIIGWSTTNATSYTISYPPVAGTYTAMLIDSSFCGQDTAYASIQITNRPTAGVSVTPSNTVCAGIPLTFINQSLSGSSFRINYGDGGTYVGMAGIGNSQNYTYNNAGSYRARLVSNILAGVGCTDTAFIDITVLPSPTANFSATPINFCDTATVIFTDLSLGAVQWAWYFDNGNTSNSVTPPSQFYANAPRTYTTSLTVTSSTGCNNTRQILLNAFKSPNVSIGSSAACANTPINLLDLSSHEPGDNIVSWLWKFGDGSSTSTNQNPFHTYITPGTYTVVLRVNTANCTDVDSIPLTIYSLPTASFTQDVTSGCTPLTVNFTDLSSNASIYEWDFGDRTAISNNQNDIHTFINTSNINDSTYTVKHIVTTINGCKDTAFQNILVNHGPKAQFTHNGIPQCGPIDVIFANTSIGASSYSWNFGDGSSTTSAINPSHTFQNTSLFLQTFTVELTVNSSTGCTDKANSQLMVYPKTDFTITSMPKDTGCHPLTVNFTASMGGSTYNWDFGDNRTSINQNPNHTFTNTGSIDSLYQVLLIVQNAFFCRDTVYKNILVNPIPAPNFIPDVINGCAPVSVNFTNSTPGTNKYKWDFDDGSAEDTSSNTSHTFSNTSNISKNFNVKLTATTASGCVNSRIKPIQAFPQVDANLGPDVEGCNPFTTQLVNQGVGGTDYTWFLGDGNFSSNSSPTHTYINQSSNDTVFKVKLILSSADGCIDSARKNITVRPTPKASFIATPTSQRYPSTTVSVSNTSQTGNHSYKWDYGDGNTSPHRDPIPHNYNTWGNYSIQLKVSTNFCSDSTSQNITILAPLPIPNFEKTPDGCAALEVSFTDKSENTNPQLNRWDFGDGTIVRGESNPNHTYIYPGTYIVKLFVEGEGGQANIAQTVTVHPIPFVAFVYTPITGKLFIPRDPLLLLNLSSNEDGETYVWDFGDGNISNEQNPTYYYSEEGTFDIKLTVTNQYGCTDSIIKPAAVKTLIAGAIQLPNAFTPSESGASNGEFDENNLDNNVFFAFTKSITEYSMRIYSRWGEILFESNDIRKGWDGYYKGKLCPRGVYIVDVVAKTIDGKTYHTTGDVTLLR